MFGQRKGRLCPIIIILSLSAGYSPLALCRSEQMFSVAAFVRVLSWTTKNFGYQDTLLDTRATAGSKRSHSNLEYSPVAGEMACPSLKAGPGYLTPKPPIRWPSEDT